MDNIKELTNDEAYEKWKSFTKERGSFESEYITFDSHDFVGDFSLQFYHCKVIKEFGPYKVGDKINTVLFDLENMILTIYEGENDAIEHIYELNLSIGKKIESYKKKQGKNEYQSKNSIGK